MNDIVQYKYYLVSILMHLCILIVFAIYFDVDTKLKKIGNADALAVSAFIYQGNHTLSLSLQDVKKLKSSIKKNEISDTHKKHAVKLKNIKNNNENNLTKSVSRSSVSQGEAGPTFIGLLHDAIQRKQNYPASALEMHRQGRVTVAFDLYEDGHISNLRVLISSGTSSLDRAAVQAVSDASPFNELLQYIKNTQEYKIDIVFELV